MRLKSFEGPWKSFLLRMARSGQGTIHSSLHSNQLFCFTFHATNLDSTAHNCLKTTSLRMLLRFCLFFLLFCQCCCCWLSFLLLLIYSWVPICRWARLEDLIRQGRKVGGIREEQLWSFLHWLVSEQQVRKDLFSSPATYTRHSSMLSNNYLEQAHPMPYTHNKSSLIHPLFTFADVDSVHSFTVSISASREFIVRCFAKRHGKEIMNYSILDCVNRNGWA